MTGTMGTTKRGSKVCIKCGAAFNSNARWFCSRVCAGLKKDRPRDAPEYQAWRDMRKRCLNPNHYAYARYGGRGITICARWDDFAPFLEDMGLRPGPTYSIERINNDGNYEPSNCKWATKKEQGRNRSVCWTEQEDADLRAALASGANYIEAAQRLGKDYGRVAARAWRLGLKSNFACLSGLNIRPLGIDRS